MKMNDIFIVCRTIWNKYLEFECKVGDLSSLLKVESRRLEAFKADFEGKTTCLLVDRFVQNILLFQEYFSVCNALFFVGIVFWTCILALLNI